MMIRPMAIRWIIRLSCGVVCGSFCSSGIADAGPSPTIVDAATMKGKVLCGYQGWFRCPGDPTGEGWRHWSRDGRRIAPETLSFEMWPDMSEHDADEKYRADGFTFADGTPAHLFSSANKKTVELHFKWMQDYGIDGVFLQRFLVHIGDRSLDLVLDHVRASAAKTGRVYAIGYDMTGIPNRRLLETISQDWKRLVDDSKITSDERYLRHHGKPVVFVWGFFSDRFDAALANKVIDVFKDEGRYQATLIGGCEWWWRTAYVAELARVQTRSLATSATEKNVEWAKAMRRFDVISPWNVGNVMIVDGKKQASTGYWQQDLEEAKKAKMEYLPVIYPGFGWTNLKGKRAERETIPRLKGEFFWSQFVTAKSLGIDMAYVAMFDEVDEGTAVFKVTNSPPAPGKFQTYEGMPSDAYLRLTAEGTKVLRGERKLDVRTPTFPGHSTP